MKHIKNDDMDEFKHEILGLKAMNWMYKLKLTPNVVMMAYYNKKIRLIDNY